MSQPTKPKSEIDITGQESSIRALIRNGKFKQAVEGAKDLHKAHPSVASEALLVDAYEARIQSLLDQNLTVEAKSLLNLVQQRFPATKARLERLLSQVSARAGDLADLLGPLNDPELAAERRVVIEQAILTQVADVSTIAQCDVLPPDHKLRQAAQALAQAFDLATSGPVTDEQIALTEVSFRSPLASWKLLIRAIACLHRGEDQICRECLSGIKPESAAYRAVAVMQALLDKRAPKSLKPPDALLFAKISGEVAELRQALESLDHAFTADVDEDVIYKAMRTAMRECQRTKPEKVRYLRQVVTVRADAAGLNRNRVADALEGQPVLDAEFFRMAALATEVSPSDIPEACWLWDQFRLNAVQERLFESKSVEEAMIYRHMAELAQQLKAIQTDSIRKEWMKEAVKKDRYFLLPDELFARACAIDPTPEGFAQWMNWASSHGKGQGEEVARLWSKACPGDVAPLLHLMKGAEKRGAFPTALGFLEKAEQLDAVHQEVRAARLRLLVAAAMNHLKKKPHLAAQKLEDINQLPQANEGDRPAFLAGLRYIISKNMGDTAGAALARTEADRLLGSTMAASILIFAIEHTAKIQKQESLPSPKSLSKADQVTIPATLARLMAMSRQVGIPHFSLPLTFVDVAVKHFANAKESLDIEQIYILGEISLLSDDVQLCWITTQEGLKRGGTTEAKFLLLRADAVAERPGDWPLILCGAAVELARAYRDMETLDKAIDLAREILDDEPFKVTLEQAREVVKREMKTGTFPAAYAAEPDYSDLFSPDDEPCNCENCRRARGEYVDPFIDPFEIPPPMDVADMKAIYEKVAPQDLPPEIKEKMFDIMKEAFLTGRVPGDFLETAGLKKPRKGHKR